MKKGDLISIVETNFPKFTFLPNEKLEFDSEEEHHGFMLISDIQMKLGELIHWLNYEKIDDNTLANVTFILSLCVNSKLVIGKKQKLLKEQVMEPIRKICDSCYDYAFGIRKILISKEDSRKGLQTSMQYIIEDANYGKRLTPRGPRIVGLNITSSQESLLAVQKTIVDIRCKLDPLYCPSPDQIYGIFGTNVKKTQELKERLEEIYKRKKSNKNSF